MAHTVMWAVGMKMSKVSAIACVLAAGCGMKINVNGKTRVIGGDDPEPVASKSATTENATTADAKTPNASAAATNASTPVEPAQIIVLATPMSSTPRVVDIASAVVDTPVGKRFGGAYSPCGNAITRAPIATLDVKVAQPGARIALTGASGLVLARGKDYWASCDTVQPNGGLEVGTYDVYPLARTYYDKPVQVNNIAVGVSDPSKAPAWSERSKRVAIAGKLAEPLFVDVEVGAEHRVRGERLHGSRCHRAAFRVEPDLVFDLARPVKGLRVRVVGTKGATTLRMHAPPRSESAASSPPYCLDANEQLAFGDSADGAFGVSVGSSAGTPERITVMVYDASTTLDPLALRPLEGPLALEHRSLVYHFPFLENDHLRLDTYARAEVAAKVFQTAPAEAFVYAKIDLDKDITWNATHGTQSFPRKNEPLLVFRFGKERSSVLAQDGFTYEMKTSHLLLAPDGEPAPLASPRRLPDGYNRVAASALLPPGNDKLAESVHQIGVAYDDCYDRVATPYNRRLPTITRPANVDVIIVSSPRARAIEDARDRAVDRACGTSDAIMKKKQAQYRLVLERVEAGRAALFQATRRSFAR
ncbi:MAG: hypothetical protein ACKV2T_16155 [Kofleriaceae bacterium]